MKSSNLSKRYSNEKYILLYIIFYFFLNKTNEITNMTVENLYKNIKGKKKGNIHYHLEFLKYEEEQEQSLFHRAKQFYSVTKLYN